MDFINLNTISKQDYKEVIQKYGGQFSLFQRVVGEPKGLGGLKLLWEKAKELPWNCLGNESAVFSIELLKNGCIFRMNDTKQAQAFLFQKTELVQIGIVDQEELITFGSQALNGWITQKKEVNQGESFQIKIRFSNGMELVFVAVVSALQQINTYFEAPFFKTEN